MTRAKILALIMAGGAGSRMDLLTDVRAKPALPYAGVYRLIDFPLSNCVHSQLSDIWVIEQFRPHSLNDHLANGRPWDLDRTYGGMRLFGPHTGTSEGGWHRGNADAIYRNKRFIREFDPDILLVLSADHIYKLDYRDAIEGHIAREADVTMVTTRVPIEQASRFGTVQIDGEEKVIDFAYKPDSPSSDVVTTEVFIYDARKLLDTLDELVAQDGDDAEEEDDEEDTALKDFGHVLLPTLVEQGRAYAYPFDGYWRDVGTIASYWESHMDLLELEPKLRLDEPGWPILTFGPQRQPARIYGSARIDQSLIAPGCTIRGQVVRSVLAPGVVVEEGAVVRDAVVFRDTVVGAGASVARAIVDRDVRVGERARIGDAEEQGAQDDADRSIALVGLAARIPAGASVPADGRVKPRTR